MGISVCYEETYGHIMRENRQLGAQLLVNLTNDGWYPQSKLSQQHFYHAIPRTVENGIALVRACNTGISAAVDSLGRVVARLAADDGPEELQPEVLRVSVPTYHYFTLYSFWGDAFILSFSVLSLIALAISKRS
jgi:apolipoprotein N-acyltransferase